MYAEYLKLLIRKMAYDYDMEVSEIEVVEDHIHMMPTAEPKESPSHIMRVIF